MINIGNIPQNPGIADNKNQNIADNTIPPLTKPQPTEDRISTVPEKSIRPMFVSLGKYKELKSCLVSLQCECSALESLISNMKSNKDTGSELLKETVNRLENIEEKVTQINSTIRV